MKTLNAVSDDRQFNQNCVAYSERTRELNDQCRRSGNFVLPLAVTALGAVEVSRIKEKIISYDEDDFSKLEDPYGVHDFGMFQHGRRMITWIIDLHAPEDTTLDPSDPEKSIRILNVHLTDER